MKIRASQWASFAILAAAIGAGAAGSGDVGAQEATQTPDAPVQYVASVKPFGGGRGGVIQMMPGRIVASGMPIRLLVQQAYGPLQGFQLVGGPGWMTSERWDIDARLEGPASATAMRAMLQQMLADRFQLKTHTEARDIPTYDLVLARADGRLGPGLKPSSPDCAALMEAGPRGRGPAPADGRGAPPPPPPGLDGRGRGRGDPGPLAFDGPPPCGSRGGGFGRLRAGGATMAAFAQQISQGAQRVVTDKTGLKGFYDIELTYTPDAGQLPAGPPPPGVELPPVDPNGPSLFTALQEQLGLKLESSRGPVTVVVIDSIERPSEN